jgi:hypothetical protein
MFSDWNSASRTSPIVVQQFLRYQQRTAGRQPLEHRPQQPLHLVLAQVVQDAPEGKQVGLGQQVSDEIAGDHLDPVRSRVVRSGSASLKVTSTFPCCHRPSAYRTSSGLCGARWSGAGQSLRTSAPRRERGR